MTKADTLLFLKNEIKIIENFYREKGLYKEADLLSNISIIESTEVEIAGVTKSGKLFYNYKYISSITSNDLHFILLHELQHLIFNSFERVEKWAKEIEAKNNNNVRKTSIDYNLLANICEDALINGMLRYNCTNYNINANVLGKYANSAIFPDTLQKYSDFKLKNQLQKELNSYLNRDLNMNLDSDLLYTVLDTPDLMNILLKVLPKKVI